LAAAADGDSHLTVTETANIISVERRIMLMPVHHHLREKPVSTFRPTSISCGGGSCTCTLAELGELGSSTGNGYQTNFVGHMFTYAVFDMKPTFDPRCSFTLNIIFFYFVGGGALTTATGNVHKYSEVRPCGFRDMRVDRQTNGPTCHNTLDPY